MRNDDSRQGQNGRRLWKAFWSSGGGTSVCHWVTMSGRGRSVKISRSISGSNRMDEERKGEAAEEKVFRWPKEDDGWHGGANAEEEEEAASFLLLDTASFVTQGTKHVDLRLDDGCSVASSNFDHEHVDFPVFEEYVECDTDVALCEGVDVQRDFSVKGAWTATLIFSFLRGN